MSQLDHNSYSDDFEELLDELDNVNVTRRESFCAITTASNAQLPKSCSTLSVTPETSSTSGRGHSTPSESLQPPSTETIRTAAASRSRASSGSASAIHSASSRSGSRARSTSIASSRSSIRTGSTSGTASRASVVSSSHKSTSSSKASSIASSRHSSASGPAKSRTSVVPEQSESQFPSKRTPSTSFSSRSSSADHLLASNVAVTSPPRSSTTVQSTAPPSPPSNPPSMLLVSTSHPPPWLSTTVNNTLVLSAKQHHDSSSILASPPHHLLPVPDVLGAATETTIPHTSSLLPAVLSPMTRLRAMVESAHSSALGLSVNAVATSAPVSNDASLMAAVRPSGEDVRQHQSTDMGAADPTTAVRNSDSLNGSPNHLTETSKPSAPAETGVELQATEEGRYSDASFESLSTAYSGMSDRANAARAAGTVVPGPAANQCAPVPNATQAEDPSPTRSTRHFDQHVSVTSPQHVQIPSSWQLLPSIPHATAPAASAGKPKADVATKAIQAAASANHFSAAAHIRTGRVPEPETHLPPRTRTNQPHLRESPVPTSSDSTSTSLLHAHMQATKRRLACENAHILHSTPAAASTPGSAHGLAANPPSRPVWAAVDLERQRVVPKAMLDRIKINMLLYDMKHLALPEWAC